MDQTRRYAVANAALAVAALGHAMLTWPVETVVALFVGGATIAFALEALGIAAGLFRHEMRPQVLGVPVVVVGAWPAITYVTYRIALLALPEGVPAAAAAAVVATALDAATEPNAVEAGVWTYPEHPLSSPRIAGVPWWNYVGWIVVVFVTAMLPSLAA